MVKVKLVKSQFFLLNFFVLFFQGNELVLKREYVLVEGHVFLSEFIFFARVGLGNGQHLLQEWLHLGNLHGVVVQLRKYLCHLLCSLWVRVHVPLEVRAFVLVC